MNIFKDELENIKLTANTLRSKENLLVKLDNFELYIMNELSEIESKINEISEI